MNSYLRRIRIRKRPSYAKPFSSHNLTLTTQRRRFDEALGVLNIVAPKPKTTTVSQKHIRVIEDFLQTDGDHINSQEFDDDFGISYPEEGPLTVFDEFIESSSVLNEIVLSTSVSFCTLTCDLRNGVQYHSLAIRTGFITYVYVGSSLISFYSKCGHLRDAYKLFEEMPVRNVVSWTAIIAGFAQGWQVDTCIEIYRMMMNSESKPNHFTFTSILSACTSSTALGQGRSVHCQVIQMGFNSYIHIANALISMYCKCGSVADAFYIFSTMHGKDIVSWNSMIAGYAQHGLALQGIDLFEEMNKQRVKPDAITFLGVLSSCRHAGLVEQGRIYFDSMAGHGVKPKLEHYSCIVDLLGRAGLLNEALNFIQKMPISPNAVMWGSLLSACRLHGNIWIGIQAAESRLSLEPGCAATHVQLANLYASVGYWDRAARVRKMMKDKGLKTNPGYSWIEMKNELYRFGAEDISNIRKTEILFVMDCLVNHMRPLGYVPEMHELEVEDALLTSI